VLEEEVIQMACARRYVPKGTTKTDVIKAMIENKLKTEHKKKGCPAAVRKKLESLHKRRREIEAAAKKKSDAINDKIQEIEEETGWGIYYYDGRISQSGTKCFVPKDDLKALDNAAVFYRLKKQKKASEMCDDLLRKYNLMPGEE
jgi:membrane-associated HD superfamily phosphohydrolase